MAGWQLVPCLVALRGEFDRIAPGRDRSSDGSIGDQAHRERTSSHNVDDGPGQGSTPSEDADSIPEVHAADITANLRTPGWSMGRAVGIIVGRHRDGEDNRLKNVIYNGKIYSRSWGWTERDYTGDNPHKKHAHFESLYTDAAEKDTRPWGLTAQADRLEKDDMPSADEVAKATVKELLSQGLGKSGQPTVGVALQTGAYQNTNKILAGLGALAQVVAGLPQAVLEELGDNTDQSALQQATILRSVLGHDRAVEIGKLLTGPQQ